MLNEKKILVLGLGSDILTDDGIACRIVDTLKSSIDNNTVEFETILSGGLDLIGILEGYEKIIIIDTKFGDDKTSGKVESYDLTDFPETLHLSNHHEISFTALLKTAKTLDISITDDITIIVIKGKEFFEFSEDFSKNIEDGFNMIFQDVKDIVSAKIILRS